MSYQDKPPAYNAQSAKPGLTIEEFLGIMQMPQHTSAFLRAGFRSIQDIAWADAGSLAALGLRESERERVLQAAKDRAPPKPAEPVVQVKLDSVKDMYGTTYKADGKGGFINDAGNTYFGEYNNAGVFHGYGTYSYGNGETYTGQWADGKREGQGRAVFNDGRVIQGNWANNMPLQNATQGMQPVKPSYAEY